MVTEKQLAANRANAQSIFPRIPEGKHRASQSAEYNSKIPAEHALANKFLSARAQALRAASLESVIITQEIPVQSEKAANEGRDGQTNAHVSAFKRHRAALERLRAPGNVERFRERKMNLNKPTHFDEATKGVIAQHPAAKAIYNPSKATWKPFESPKNHA